METYDFSGWATKNDLRCSDGRTIRKDAFKHNDGKKVPLVWNHRHNESFDVLGHALLENRDEGVYAYCKFNDTESGKNAKLLVQHGDINQLSIYANQLKQQGSNVMHGTIREVSLVLAGANPGAFIDSVMVHGEESEEEAVIYTGEDLVINHGDTEAEEIQHADDTEAEEVQHSDDTEDDESVKKKDKSVQDVIDSMTEEQRNVMYNIIGELIDDDDDDDDDDNDENEEVEHSEGDEGIMKTNVFDQETAQNTAVLSHSELNAIVDLAKKPGVGSLREAFASFMENNEKLAHGIDDIETLFPDPHLLNPGAPEIIRSQEIGWVTQVINKIHKSPYSRVRTRHADARIAELKAKGYQKKGDEKTIGNNIKLLGRKTEPQTVYVKDELHRDDIIDIDFDVSLYMMGILKDTMNETLALAALVGDGRDDTDPDKIHEENIRSIWNDEELYTMHHDVDIEAMRTKLQGTNTSANFGEEYIYAEAIIAQSLFAREKYKGSGKPDFYCTPHLVNVMLLARDLNGRRIYDSKADLAKALNVGEIYEIEQLEDKIRTTKEGDKKKLLGLFVNLSDYQFGCSKGGELTKFEDFEIDFNKYKYLLETRMSGALIKPMSAIALEEPTEAVAG